MKLITSKSPIRLVTRKGNELLLRFSYSLLNLSLYLIGVTDTRNLITISRSDTILVDILLVVLLVASISLMIDSALSLYRTMNSSNTHYKLLTQDTSSYFDKLCYYANRYRHYQFLILVIVNLSFISISYHYFKVDPHPGQILDFPLFYICISLVIIGILAAFLDAISDNEVHKLIKSKTS